jgi:hypothetical protein
MVMGLEGLIHQIHCRSMGAIVGMGFLGHSSPRKNNHVNRKKTQDTLELAHRCKLFWSPKHVLDILTSKFHHCWSLF